MKTAAKDFKMTELGPIPKDWDVKRFDDCFDFAAAGDLREECYNRERVGNCVYPIFSNSLANKGLYGYTSSPRYKADSITITGRGTLGHAEYRGEAFDAIIRLLILTPKQEVDCRFVVDWINHINPFVNESTSIPQLTVPQVAGSWFVFPPLPEQRKIAAALSDVDEMIVALEKLIEKKRKIKTGAMQRLLTGKTRLPGFKGAWVEKRLGDCADIRTGKRNGDEQTPSGMYPFFVRSQVVYRIDSYSFDGEAILVPGEGGIGSIFHYINGKFDYHQRVYKISDFTDGVCGKFLFHYLKRYFGEWALSQTVKATVDSLRLPTFENFIMIVPPSLAEQKAIAKVLGDMDEEIAALEAELAKTRQLKQGMMQELLTGKTRL